MSGKTVLSWGDAFEKWKKQKLYIFFVFDLQVKSAIMLSQTGFYSLKVDIKNRLQIFWGSISM